MTETKIPFAGFYETTHSSRVNDFLLMEYGCDNPDHQTEEWKAREDCYADICCSKATHEESEAARHDYCIQYVREFSELIGVPLKFKELTSPREYNFVTDRIFCEISEEDVEKLKERVDQVKTREYVKRHFTSRDRFFSFYPNDYDKWLTDAKEKPFDHNQICALLDCIAECELEDDWQMYVCDGFGR